MISLGWDNFGTTVATAFEGTNKGPLSSNLVTPARFERATCRLGGNCSIQLNYGAISTAKDSKTTTAADSLDRRSVRAS
jgi:hypothetical protein